MKLNKKFLSFWFVLCFSLYAGAAHALHTLIAVAAQTAVADAPISLKVESAPYFLLFDHEGRFLRALPNSAVGNLANTASLLAKNKVTVLVGGGFNSQALELLAASSIIPIRKQGNASAAVTALLQCETPDPKTKK